MEIDGETVRRPCAPASATIHRLLEHLRANRFDRAPRFLDFDAQGREVLTRVAGAAGDYPLRPEWWSDESLVAAAQLLRRYHDCTTTFERRPDDVWQGEVPPDQAGDVICHNDFAPFNCTYREGAPWGLFDFDLAAPGSRAWDLAHAAYRFVPLSSPAQCAKLGLTNLDQIGRLRLFFPSYGPDVALSWPLILRRVEAIRSFTARAIAAGGPAAMRLEAEGHLAAYDADLAHLRSLSASDANVRPGSAER